MTNCDPLVSYIVKCYNQSAYIGLAIDGALAQTYQPIEYVIGDDASVDGSVQIITERLTGAGYHEEESEAVISEERTIRRFVKDGTVAWLICNKVNRGNCGNWQTLCEFAHGELFVKADGDDISLPERTRLVVDAWRKAGSGCGVIYSNAIKIDESGREIGDATCEVFEKKFSLGAVMACVRACVDEFGGCAQRDAYDDVVYHRRAEILGLGEARIPDKLVKYRIGSGESTNSRQYVKTLARNVNITCWSLICTVADLDFSRGRVDERRRSELVDRYERNLRSVQNELPLWESQSIRERLRAFRMVHPNLDFNLRYCIHLFLLLPYGTGKWCLNVLYRLKGRL